MTNNIEHETRAIVAHIDEPEHQQPETNTQPPLDTIQDIYVLIIREGDVVYEDQVQVVGSEPTKPQSPNPSDYVTLCIVLLCCLPMLASILLQVYFLLNPPIATVTVIPKSQTFTLTGTLQLGRLLLPLTIGESQTVPTTGKGHQDARSATGYLTFYNGLFNSQTIQAGTIFTGSSGVHIITDQDAIIPAGNPPSYGQVTVPAHAINPGMRGNIPPYDIDQIFSNAILVKNTNSFYGGQDERDFHRVAKSDIDTAATALQTAIAQSMHGALTAQVKQYETLVPLPCKPMITSDHHIGEEAARVKVTVTQTCSAVAYNSQELEMKTTALLVAQEATKFGTGYRLFGDIQVTMTQATVTWTAPLLPDHRSSQISQSERYTVKNSQEKERRNARKNIQSRIQAHSGAAISQWGETTSSDLSRTQFDQ